MKSKQSKTQLYKIYEKRIPQLGGSVLSWETTSPIWTKHCSQCDNEDNGAIFIELVCFDCGDSCELCASENYCSSCDSKLEKDSNCICAHCELKPKNMSRWRNTSTPNVALLNVLEKRETTGLGFKQILRQTPKASNTALKRKSFHPSSECNHSKPKTIEKK